LEWDAAEIRSCGDLVAICMYYWLKNDAKELELGVLWTSWEDVQGMNASLVTPSLNV